MMNEIDRKSKIKRRLIYVLLIIVCLSISLMHYFVANDAVQSTRPWSPDYTFFTPAPFLFVKWLGEFATTFLIVLMVILGLTWKYERLLSWGTISGISIFILLFTTVYGLYCCFILSKLIESKG